MNSQRFNFVEMVRTHNRLNGLTFRNVSIAVRQNRKTFLCSEPAHRQTVPAAGCP